MEQSSLDASPIDLFVCSSFFPLRSIEWLLQGFNDLVAVERTRQALKVSRNVAALNDEGGGGGGWMRGKGMVRCGARHGKTWEHATGSLYGGYILEFRDAPSFVDKPMRRKRKRKRKRGL